MKHVLLVEDDIFLAKIHKFKLTKRGFEVTHLENGRDVVETIKLGKPDVVVLDLLMPEVDGFAALKEIRKDPKN